LGGGKWWDDLKCGVQEYLKLSNEADPIFQAMLPNLCTDKGITLVEADQATMFKDLSDAVSHKFQKVGMTRRFQYIGAAEEFCDKWTERYIVMYLLCAM
jgi:hypothetical protein